MCCVAVPAYASHSCSHVDVYANRITSSGIAGMTVAAANATGIRRHGDHGGVQLLECVPARVIQTEQSMFVWLLDEWIDGCMHGWMDEWMDGWTNGWMDKWINGWMDK
jgi:hypothetical protein